MQSPPVPVRGLSNCPSCPRFARRCAACGDTSSVHPLSVQLGRTPLATRRCRRGGCTSVSFCGSWCWCLFPLVCLCQNHYRPFEDTASASSSSPTVQHRWIPKTNLNNHSIVTVIEYQGVKIFSHGDNEASILGGTARRCSIQGGHKEHSCPCRAASWSGVRVPPGSFRSHISVVDHHFGRKDGGHECYRSILHQVRRMERTEEERRLREQEMSHDSK